MKVLRIVYLFRQLFCRGKHRTVQQDAIFLKFMQSHKDIARASSRANRLETSLAWAGLSQALNAVGPPCKSDEDWRRVSDVTAMTNTQFLRSCSPYRSGRTGSAQSRRRRSIGAGHTNMNQCLLRKKPSPLSSSLIGSQRMSHKTIHLVQP